MGRRSIRTRALIFSLQVGALLWVGNAVYLGLFDPTFHPNVGDYGRLFLAMTEGLIGVPRVVSYILDIIAEAFGWIWSAIRTDLGGQDPLATALPGIVDAESFIRGHEFLQAIDHALLALTVLSVIQFSILFILAGAGTKFVFRRPWLPDPIRVRERLIFWCGNVISAIALGYAAFSIDFLHGVITATILCLCVFIPLTSTLAFWIMLFVFRISPEACFRALWAKRNFESGNQPKSGSPITSHSTENGTWRQLDANHSKHPVNLPVNGTTPIISAPASTISDEEAREILGIRPGESVAQEDVQDRVRMAMKNAHRGAAGSPSAKKVNQAYEHLKKNLN